MTKDFFKTVLAGILAGVALFMLPHFVIKILIILILIKLSFHLLGFGRHRMCHSFHYHNMSDEQKEAFKQKFGNHNCCNSRKTENLKQE
jgi:hypothetical protein